MAIYPQNNSVIILNSKPLIILYCLFSNNIHIKPCSDDSICLDSLSLSSPFSCYSLIFNPALQVRAARSSQLCHFKSFNVPTFQYDKSCTERKIIRLYVWEFKKTGFKARLFPSVQITQFLRAERSRLPAEARKQKTDSREQTTSTLASLHPLMSLYSWHVNLTKERKYWMNFFSQIYHLLSWGLSFNYWINPFCACWKLSDKQHSC